MYKLVIIALLVNLGLCQEFIKESNMWQLDKDSFWKVASRMEVHSVIELYSSDSWCVHCRTLHPIFRKIAEKYRKNKDIVFARMDLSTFKPVDLKVIGYPSIKVFRRGNEEVDYWGDNNEEDITDFIESSVLKKHTEM